MKTLILMAGIPGSGKSRWAKDYAKNHRNTLIVDTDETRKKITGSYLVFPSDMKVIFDEMIKEGNDFLSSNESECTLIEDSIFLDDYRREYYMKRLKGYDKAILVMLKAHDYSLCYLQNKRRERDKWVPDNVIDGMIKMYKDPSKEVAAYFDEIKEIYIN
ncbi:MAG: AAA family ATPase [Bacilli bacterium]|jgi:predicted kinase|nr:AAA family ATPase [Bacilli bacterium]MCH4210722.1 AAA family ATPase [Bacilli bacterium]MCH4228243.1 AAA family ATPase [Bacilli bacterium]MCH4278005.1 AAA family ATPase [Bacilli bacterium]